MLTTPPSAVDEVPGPIVLFGSGEAAPSARRAHAFALERIAPPVRATVLETPAGFEPNSARVANRLAEYLRHRFQLETRIVPARRRGTPESPDELPVVAPLLTSNYVMLGPGSPTYAVRQLSDSLAWHVLVARHRMGGALVLASAAAIAASAFALPVYEIYKVGQDLHWQRGLDLLGPYGGRIAVIPHWNNTEGGDQLDTSHSYMGRERFEQLCAMLPHDVHVLGIDEHTAVVLDFLQGNIRILGRGGMTWLDAERSQRFDAGSIIALDALGFRARTSARDGIPAQVWQTVQDASDALDASGPPQPTATVQVLVAERSAARARGDWSSADRLRDQIAAAGWNIRDTPDGPEFVRI